MNTLPDNIRIINYDPKYKRRFHDLTIEWLEKYFSVEPVHRHALLNPEKEILDTGGDIFFALVDGEVLGTVAVRQEAEGVYELTKLGVSPKAQGLGLGRLLCERVIDFFLENGGKRLFLETHTKLGPAMRLYEKLNFTMKPNPSNQHYEGTDCYMEWEATRDGK